MANELADATATVTVELMGITDILERMRVRAATVPREKLDEVIESLLILTSTLTIGAQKFGKAVRTVDRENDSSVSEFH